jgi:hypothetical protein
MILVNRNCDSHSHLIQTDTRVANSRTFKWCCYEITWDATWVEWMWRMWRFGYAKTSMLLGNRWVLVCFSDFGDFRHVLLINDVSWVVFDNFSPRTLSKSYCWTRVRTTTKGCTRKLQGACIESVFIVARCSKALKPTSCATPYDWLVDWLIVWLIDWLFYCLLFATSPNTGFAGGDWLFPHWSMRLRRGCCVRGRLSSRLAQYCLNVPGLGECCLILSPTWKGIAGKNMKKRGIVAIYIYNIVKFVIYI